MTGSDASKAACPVDGHSGAGNPGTTVTVWNLPGALSPFMFAGAAGNAGLATFDAGLGRWWIVQLECGAAGGGGGGGGGFTGTIGN